MKPGILALVIIAVAMLVMVGCSPKLGAPGIPESEKEGIGSADGTEDVQVQSITGSLSQIDSLDSELTDPELEKTGEYIDEIDW